MGYADEAVSSIMTDEALLTLRVGSWQRAFLSNTDDASGG
jgi:hypothetical protein